MRAGRWAGVTRQGRPGTLGSLGSLLCAAWLGGCLVASGCAPPGAADDDEPVPPDAPPGFIPASPQRSGDAQRGYDTLVNFGYVRCGVPYSLFAAFAKLSPVPEEDKLPGRTGHNAALPYYLSSYTTKKGVELVTLNCMVCHTSRMGGKLVVGLGEINSNYTSEGSAGALLPKVLGLAKLLTFKAGEKEELSRFISRTTTVDEYLITRTRGTNPADNLGAVLAAHRDPKTLAWSDTALILPPEKEPVPLDVPPWWRMRKKNALYYLGFGRGDHARLLMASSMLCTDSTAEADEIEARFPDVRAFLTSLEPPRYPLAIDAALAETGRGVFAQTCAGCHGTYGEGGRYPNRLINVDQLKTDPALVASSKTPRGVAYMAWLNESWFGQSARIEPGDGYVAPPLDGIWATAPFLHNGSVPTLEALLDSSRRPRYWTRRFVPDQFDARAVGLPYTPLDHGQLDEKDPKRRAEIYDTTLYGYSASGHTFGDALSAADRAAVIEYLKTL